MRSERAVDSRGRLDRRCMLPDDVTFFACDGNQKARQRPLGRASAVDRWVALREALPRFFGEGG